MSPSRFAIEQMLSEGLPPQAIVKRLSEGEIVTERNMIDHLRNGHLPIKDEAVVQFRDAVAERDGDIVSRGAAAIADHLLLARLVVGRVAERVESGAATPSVSEGLAAARLLAEAAPSKDVDGNTLITAMIDVREAVKAEVTADQYHRIVARATESQRLRRIKEEGR